MFYYSNVTGVLTLQMFWDSNVASIQILLGSALLVDIDSTYLIEQVCSNIAIIWPVDQGLFFSIPVF